MKYTVDSDYFVRYGQFLTKIARWDVRSRQAECLVWSWKQIEAGELVPEECWLHQDKFENEAFLQAMLDLAWSRGLKPAGFKEDKPELEAVKYHLEDMRRLVFRGEKP